MHRNSKRQVVLLTVEEVKAMLNQTYFCYKRINQLQERIGRWRAKAERMTPTYSLAPGGGGEGHGHVETDVLLMVEMEGNLEQEIAKYRKILNDNTAVIETLPDPYQRTILSEHYIYGETYDDIAESLQYSIRQIHNIKDQALQWLADNIK